MDQGGRKILNVQESELWRDRVEKEERCAKEAPDKWGYMYGDMHRLLPPDDLKKYQGRSYVYFSINLIEGCPYKSVISCTCANPS